MAEKISLSRDHDRLRHGGPKSQLLAALSNVFCLLGLLHFIYLIHLNSFSEVSVCTLPFEWKVIVMMSHGNNKSTPISHDFYTADFSLNVALVVSYSYFILY